MYCDGKEVSAPPHLSLARTLLFPFEYMVSCNETDLVTAAEAGLVEEAIWSPGRPLCERREVFR